MIRVLVIVLVVVCVCRVREHVYASRLQHLHVTGLRKGENIDLTGSGERGWSVGQVVCSEGSALT